VNLERKLQLAMERIAELESAQRQPEPPGRSAKGAKAMRGAASSDWWCSPPEVTVPLAEFFGGPVDFDPCSNPRSIVLALQSLYSGGLTLPWRLRKPVNWTCYENFPFSQPVPWTAKLISELKLGNVREHVRLSQMDSSTQWWADMCTKPRRNPRILALKRIAFLDPFAEEAGMKRESSRFAPALTYFGPRTEKFTRAFAHLTRWTAWGRS
jgi:hypothetical protein